jgi:threonine/homoserine/homoserine lactone efflux protein
VDVDAVLSFWLISMMFILTPGVDWAYAISAGIAGDKIIAAVSGLMLGHFVAILLVVAGVGSLLSALPVLLNTIALAGAMYLVWIAVSLFKCPPVPTNYATDSSVQSDATWMRKGFLISGLNPKVMLLFIALLPQFITPLGLSPQIQLFILGMIHFIGCTIVYFLVSIFARRILSNSPGTARRFSRISASILMLLGAGLVFDSVKSLYTSL